jgi:hypothetical protein
MPAPFIFHHIPKAGGTSIRTALSNWFTVLDDYRPYCTIDSNEFIHYRNNFYDISKYNDKYLIAGHYEYDGIHVFQRYPAMSKGSELKVFTFLRDPLTLAISLYYHGKNVVGYDDDYTLDKHLSTVYNFTSSVLGVDKSNYKSILNHYLFIGIVETSQMSLDILADILKKPHLQLPQLNASEKDSQFYMLKQKTIDLFNKNNQLDIAIYEYAKSIFENYTSHHCDVNKE